MHIKNYFDAEIQSLRECAKEFAAHYPEEAAELGLAGLKQKDPYVERLLEGMAFLVGQIRQKIEDDLPEIYESLIMHLWPQLIFPVPSFAVFQIEPEINQLQAINTLPACAEIISQSVGEEKTSCIFKTCMPVKQHPISLVAVTLNRYEEAMSRLTLTLETHAAVNFGDLNLSTLKFFIHADFSMAVRLYYSLVAHVQVIKLSYPEHRTIEPILLGNQTSLVACHLDANDFLLPASSRSFSGFQQLLEYFCFKEKYLFVELKGLDAIVFPSYCKKLEIAIYLNEEFSDSFLLGVENFKLHCSPAINLFDTEAEPIHATQLSSNYLLIPKATHPESVKIYEITSVVGNEINSEKEIVYCSMHDYRYEKIEDYYHVSRKWLNAVCPSCYLSLNGENSLLRQIVSVAIRATNGNYPHRYLNESVSTLFYSPKIYESKIKLLIRPSCFFYPKERKNFQWKLIEKLSLNFQGISSLDNLKQLLTLYNFSENLENKRKIDGLSALSISPINTVSRGMVFNGLAFSLHCKEENYRSIADIYLFGSILHQLFSQYVAFNFYVITKIQCYPSGESLQWNSMQNN